MKTTSLSLALVGAAVAQDMSICDKYTTALLKNNTAANQQTLLTLVVNTAVIGNYTKPNVGIAVPGILAPGTGKWEGVSLAPYFTGALASTAPRDGSNMGVSVNFLDGGGATPLMANMPANSTSSAQYQLLTHLYSYFGYLLGCSEFSNTTAPYAGSTSMYKVHQYMGLSNAEVGYFIEQVGLSAASFGVTTDDVTAVGKALNDAFGYRCSPPASIPASASPALQAICIASDCPIAPSATCDAYAAVVEPSSVGATSAPTMPANGTSTILPTGSLAPSSTSSPTTVPYMGDASTMPILSGLSAVMLGAVAFLL